MFDLCFSCIFCLHFLFRFVPQPFLVSLPARICNKVTGLQGSCAGGTEIERGFDYTCKFRNEASLSKFM